MTQQAQDQRQAPEADRKPETSFRHGAIGGSIWRQETTDGGHFYNFTLSRSWKSDANGKSGYSGSFSERNAADLQKTIADCVEWIQAHSKQSTDGTKSTHVESLDVPF